VYAYYDNADVRKGIVISIISIIALLLYYMININIDKITEIWAALDGCIGIGKGRKTDK